MKKKSSSNIIVPGNNCFITESMSRRRSFQVKTRVTNRRRSTYYSSISIQILLLTALLSCSISIVRGFYGHPQKIQRQQYYNGYSILPTTSLTSRYAFFRPDWMRRAGRIEEKRKERRKIFDSFRKRQKELGIVPTKTMYIQKNKQQKPQKYLVVSSLKEGNCNEDDGDDVDLLKVYLFVPENDSDSTDESNIFDQLRNGEIVTLLSMKRVLVESRNYIGVNKTASDDKTPTQEIIWIEHDRGGWSPSIVDGITRLIPMRNEDKENHY